MVPIITVIPGTMLGLPRRCRHLHLDLDCCRVRIAAAIDHEERIVTEGLQARGENYVWCLARIYRVVTVTLCRVPRHGGGDNCARGTRHDLAWVSAVKNRPTDRATPQRFRVVA